MFDVDETVAGRDTPLRSDECNQATKGGAMQGWKVALGAFCCGIVVGWLVYTFVRSSKELTFKVLSGLVTVAVGTAAMAVFRTADALSDDFMFYFVGMAITIATLGALRVDAEAATKP